MKLILPIEVAAEIEPHLSTDIALFLDNLTRYQTGISLQNVVDQQADY